MAGLKTPVSVIWQVVKARTEGMGLNAAAAHLRKPRIRSWLGKESFAISIRSSSSMPWFMSS